MAWNSLPFIYLLLFLKAQCDSTALSKTFAQQLTVWEKSWTGQQESRVEPIIQHLGTSETVPKNLTLDISLF